MDEKEVKKIFGKSKKGNFAAIDSIGVPHPYMIMPRHVSWASDHHMGMLSKESIIDAEKNGGAKCGICRGQLSYEEHKQAVLIECKVEANKNKELHEYLLSIKDLATKHNFEGFAFKKAKEV